MKAGAQPQPYIACPPGVHVEIRVMAVAAATALQPESRIAHPESLLDHQQPHLTIIFADRIHARELEAVREL